MKSVLAAGAMLLAAGLATGGSRPEPVPWSKALHAPGAAERERWDAAARIDVEATWDGTAVVGHLDLAWRNDTGTTLTELVLTTYANQSSYHGASMEVLTASVEGRPVTPQVIAQGLGVRLPLARPLAPGGTVRGAATFRHTLSHNEGYHGIACQKPGGPAVLHGWYPDLALWADGRWQVDPLPTLCDPARSVLAHVTAHLRVPDGGSFPVGGTVTAVEDEPGPFRRLTIVSPFTRNLTVVVGGPWVRDEEEVDGIKIRVWATPATATAAPLLRESTAAAVQRCAAAFGPYPFRELDVVVAPLGQEVGGVESTGLYLMDDHACAVDTEADRGQLEMIAAHETAHAWWYQLVGNDPLRATWLDESLTNWTTLWLLEQRSPALRRMQEQEIVMEGLMGHTTGPFPPLHPDTWKPTEEDYACQVYGRGAVAYAALRREVGDTAWFACLRSWATAQRWRLATPEDWQAHLRATLGVEVADRFWDRWILGHGLKPSHFAEAFRPPKAH